VNLIDYYRPAVLLYPSKMLYPDILPLVTMLDALFKDAAASQRKLKVFWIAFFWLVACQFRVAEENWTYHSLNLRQHLFLGDSSGVDVPTSHRIVNILPCQSKLARLHPNLWRIQWE
jgi:hypothetical protein